MSDTQTVVLAITHASLGNNIFRNLLFSLLSVRIVSNLEQQPGCLGFKVKNAWGRGEAWTLTQWRDHASLDTFVQSQRHRQGVRYSFKAMDQSRFLRLELPRERIPQDWRAIQKLFHDTRCQTADPHFSYWEIPNNKLP